MTKILGVKIDKVNLAEALAKIQAFLLVDELHQIVTVNPEFIMGAQKDDLFKRIINESFLAIPDGVGLQFAASFLGVKIGERLTGVDLTWEIAKIAAEKNYSIYLLGAKPGVGDMVKQKLELIYPNLKIAGTYAGSPDEEGITDKINESEADILLVAFGAPGQEKFIYENKEKLKVKLAMGVGGTFDYIAGIVPRAPEWLRNIGLEWFYRLVKQPQRLNRIITATIKFPLAVLFSRFK